LRLALLGSTENTVKQSSAGIGLPLNESPRPLEMGSGLTRTLSHPGNTGGSDGLIVGQQGRSRVQGTPNGELLGHFAAKGVVIFA